MTDRSYDADVIVAGAGPAGAVAARTLALDGLDTLLIDRADFPRNKPCGGGLTSRALPRFPWLDEAMSGIDLRHISRVHFEGPNETVLDIEHDEPCLFTIRRVEFDAVLVRAAQGAGARFERFDIAQASQDALGVTLRSRDGRHLRAPVIVAADGVHSVLSKRLGVNAGWPRTCVALDMMEETPDETLRAQDPGVMWVAYAHAGLDGYAYIFPKLRHVNVGIGCLLSHYDESVSAHPYDLQKSLVAGLVARGALHGRSERTHFTPSLIPVGGPLANTWAGRVVFAGDAGGFVNAITAEGIYYAMVSGELAARAVIAARGASAGPGYERLWKREIGAELRDAVRIQRYLFRHHDRVARVVAGAGTLAGFTDMILDYFKGGLSYGALRRRMLMKCPMTIWRIASDQAREPAHDRMAS